MSTAEKLMAKARADFLLHQLTCKFGVLPAEIEARVRGAKKAELDRWGEAVLTAGTLDEVFTAK